MGVEDTTAGWLVNELKERLAKGGAGSVGDHDDRTYSHTKSAPKVLKHYPWARVSRVIHVEREGMVKGNGVVRPSAMDELQRRCKAMATPKCRSQVSIVVSLWMMRMITNLDSRLRVTDGVDGS